MSDTLQVTDRRSRPRFGIVYHADLTSPEVQRLRPTAFRVWVMLATYTPAAGGPWAVGLRQLAADLGLGGSLDTQKKAIRAALDELVALGLVARQHAPGPTGGQGWNRYALLTPPSELAREGGGKSPPAPGGEQPPAPGGEQPPAPGGESAPPSQTPVRSTDRPRTPPNPPQAGGRAPRRHDRKREAALDELARWSEAVRAGFTERVEEYARLFSGEGAAYLDVPLDELLRDYRASIERDHERELDKHRERIEADWRAERVKRGA